MDYYPVTPEEIAEGFRRKARGELGTIPVRQDHKLLTGEIFPMMAWGHPNCYEIVVHDGKLYGVPRVDQGWPVPTLNKG